jgi:hypothetical protein
VTAGGELRVVLIDVLGSQSIFRKMSNGVDKHFVPFNRKDGPVCGRGGLRLGQPLCSVFNGNLPLNLWRRKESCE